MTATIYQWPKNDELAIRQMVNITFPSGYKRHLQQRDAFYGINDYLNFIYPYTTLGRDKYENY